MTLPTFCSLLGIVELSLGAALLIWPAQASKRLLELSEHDLLYRVIGMLTALFCAAPLVGLWLPDVSLAGMIRGIAWIGLIKGLFILWFPQRLLPVAKSMLSSPIISRFFGGCASVAGILLLIAAGYV